MFILEVAGPAMLACVLCEQCDFPKKLSVTNVIQWIRKDWPSVSACFNWSSHRASFHLQERRCSVTAEQAPARTTQVRLEVSKDNQFENI